LPLEPSINYIMNKRAQQTDIDLSVTIAGIRLKNPVMAASGTCGYGEELSLFLDLNLLGAIVTKGVSLKPSQGNPPPRIVETPSGMLNAIGLQNVGLEEFVTKKLPFLRTFQVPVIANCYGKSTEEYVELCSRLSTVEGIAGLEVNISCPNVKEGGICFGTDQAQAHALVRAVRAATKLPLIVKLSPNVTDIALIARSAEAAGADALSVSNTFTGMAVDVATCRPKLANITGGLSGPAIRPLSLRMVWETVKAVSIPVIGLGGIMAAEDALQYLITGARAIQIGTALLVNPDAPLRIIAGMEQYLRQRGCSSVNDIIGCLKIS
jgi:dihydroorotate dehydrogenase (NAD+) catalytic subunit